MLQDRTTKPIDIHVHVVGTGAGGTGCWLRMSGWRRPLAWFMLRHLGMPWQALSGDFDRLWVERLLQWTQQSSLGAVVILAQDQVYDPQGRRVDQAGTFYVPNDYVFQLAKKHPQFLPGVSIHPARPDALEELDRCLAAGAVLLKCLPNCQNIDCNDPRFTRFWERMAEARLPLLAHTGGEHTVEVVRPDLATPRVLKLPLECGVTVIAAHCGARSGLWDTDFFSSFAEMTRHYPNLYGDISAFSVPIRGRHVPECLQAPLASRLVHGSDFPVPVYAYWSWLRGYIPLAACRTCERIPNLLEKDLQLKRALGFPEATFTRAWQLLRRGPERPSNEQT